MVGEQKRRQRDTHVVLDVVSQHAQEHVCFYARREPVIDGAHLHIHALQRSERPLDKREALISRNSLLRHHLVRWQAGAHDVNAIQPRLGRDLVLAPPEGEAAAGARGRRTGRRGGGGGATGGEAPSA